ncbi:MAG: GIY-YIG nuclease family protein [Candidatus Moraniibacteriota bacterium]
MTTLWEKIYTLEAFQKKNMLPEVPGVYFFLDEKKGLLYIGKATSLRDRVKSYFSRDISATRGPKISLMLDRARFIAYTKTESVLEALILETNLIKKHQPSHNTDAKDDKSYNSVVITNEKFPCVLIVRGRDILKKNQESGIKNHKYKKVFGPFPSGGGLREAMKIVRKLFPFRDKCMPANSQQLTVNRQQETENKKESRACFNRQIGLCPGVCTGEISAREYGKIINNIRLFFEGHKNTVVKELKKEMRGAVKKLEFERANEIKKTLFGLQHIQDVALIKDDVREINAHRIEAYDVAHLGGSSSVGVMTVVQNSKSNSSEYRQFKLRGEHNGNDLTALEEILIRRLKHKEWPLPELLVVDGSLLQSAVAEKVLSLAGLSLSIVGVVKNSRHQPERLIGPEALTKRFKKEILLANSEAHRFAITFHRKRRGKEFLV